MRVGVISADWAAAGVLGGSGFHRVGQPMAALERFGGVEVTVTNSYSVSDQHGIAPLTVPGDPSSRVEGCDIIVFQRLMDDFVPAETEIAQRAGQVVIQDVDDWFWGLATTNNAFDGAHPKLNPDRNINHYRKALGACDMITVSTRYLADRLAKLNKPIALLANMIDLSLYQPNTVDYDRAPNVGWTGGIPWRSGDLEELQGILGPWMAQHGLKFIHGGKHDSQEHSAAQLLGLDRYNIEVEERRAVPVDRYPALFAGMDIFVAPLSDRPFNLSKSACKLLEAAAAGVPYVASHVGPYAEWDGGGRTARRPRDWRRHLDALLDPVERERQRQAQLDAAATQDVTVRWMDWMLVYEYSHHFRAARLARTMREMDLLSKELSRRGITVDA